MIEINMLAARSGDLIHIMIKDQVSGNRNIIVDSGIGSCASLLEEVMKNIENQGGVVDLMIVTHTDRDHIGGLIRLIDEDRFRYDLVKEFWINDGELINVQETDLLTAQDGRKLIDTLEKKGININKSITTDHNIQLGLAMITVLSPTEEDLNTMKKKWIVQIESDNLAVDTVSDNLRDLDDLMLDDHYINDNNQFNNASITFLLSTNDVSGLFLGDASSNTILNGLSQSSIIEKGEIDFIKIPHHGSERNTSSELLKTFKTENYLISTNGSQGKPNKRTIARILKENRNANLFCNYAWWENQDKFTENDYNKYIYTKKLVRHVLKSTAIRIVEGVQIKNA